MSEMIKQEPVDSRLYKESQEGLRKAEKIDDQKGKELSKKIANIQKKLEEKFGGKGSEFFIRNMNDYLQSKYNAHFDLLEKGGKNEMVLVLGDGFNKDKLNDLVNKLIVKDDSVYIDENKDGSKQGKEKGVSLSDKRMQSDETFVSKDEAKRMSGGTDKTEKMILGGKIILDNNSLRYKIGDKDVKPTDFFNELSNEYFDKMDIEDINKKLTQEGAKIGFQNYKGTITFAVLPKEGFEEVGKVDSENWKDIFKASNKVDLTSLQKVLGVKEIQAKKEVNDNKEKKEGFTGWGEFYFGGKGEVWNIPDKWENINYDGYMKDYNGLKGDQISIGARNSYDADEKNNKFSLKQDIDLGEGKKGKLIVGENPNKVDLKGLNTKDANAISSKLKDSGVEAWFVTYTTNKEGKDEVNIKEVGDKKVHTVTETSGAIDKGKDKNNPIAIPNNEYKFTGNIDGSIKFELPKAKSNAEILKSDNGTDDIVPKISSLNIGGKNIKLEEFKGEENEKIFKKIFPGGKSYLQLSNNEVIELSYDKTKGIQIKDIGKKDIKTIDVGGVQIQQKGAESLSYNKETNTLKFPSQIGWGSLSCKLDKKGDKVDITLGEKINGTEIKIHGFKMDKNIDPDKLYQGIMKSMLYLGTSPTKIQGENKKLPNGVKQGKKTIDINYELLSKESSLSLLKKLDTSKKTSETFIMDTIKENIIKNYNLKESEKKDNKSDKTKQSKKTKKEDKTHS